MQSSARRGRLEGVAVALIGFGITRLFVAEAIRVDTPAAFVVAGLLPLLVGLGLSLYGVALAIGTSPPAHASTVARWCLGGTAAMVGVLAVTSLEPLLAGEGPRPLGDSPLLVANILLAGAVGGTVIGARSAANARQRREIRRQANRALLLDRLLRHEVINAATIVLAQTERLRSPDAPRDDAIGAIDRAARRITDTIDEVGDLIEERDDGATVDLAEILAAEVAAVRERFPDLSIAYDGPEAGTIVDADDRLRVVVRELLANAGEGADISHVEVDLRESASEVSFAVSDDGAGLSERHRRLLSAGSFPEYDDPSAGFGLQIVRLIVTRFGGRISVDDGIDGAGTGITVALRRAQGEGTVASVGVSTRDLARAGIAGTVAGVAMGAFWVATADLLPVIGALYGVADPIVGWATHLFHSLVFAFVFAAAVSAPSLRRFAAGPARSALWGVAWGAILWLVAAGVIMPLWLQSVGIMAVVPNLTGLGLASHVVWGAVLGGTYAALRDRTPLPSRLLDR